MVDGSPEGSVNLDGIMAAQPHARQLFVGKMFDHLQQARVAAEQVLAEVGSAFDKILLVLPVADLTETPHQQSVAVVLDQVVPVGAPDALNDVPSRAAKNRFQLLDDFPVAAHWAVEPLQVAVHDEDQVVEPFARGKRDRAQRFGFVHFAVTKKGPDFSAGALLQSSILQVLDETRVVNRLNRTQAHRDGRKLPEVGHEPGMRVRTQSATGFQFAAKVLQFFLGDAAFQIRAGIHARRGMSLKIDHVAVAGFGLCPQEMIERDFVQRGRGGERRDMSADAFLNFVSANDHGQRVPANQALDAAFHLLASWKRSLLPRRNRVLVGSGRRKRQVDAGFTPGVQS